MARNVVLGVAGAMLLVGLYFAWTPIMSGWALASTGAALLAPASEPVKPAITSVKQQPLSGFAAKFSNRLMILDDGTPRDLDVNKLSGVKYWAFYYSASWCPPCRAFTPDLVSFYKDFKPKHPDFELIFVNDDQNETDMLNYMRNDGMTWPAVWYADIDNPDLDVKKYCGEGIPCLVLVDAEGQVISDTYQNGQYTDPHRVINDIRAMVQ